MPATVEEVDVSESDHGSTVPLVLIHDGGGTIFQYHLLGPVQRKTYAVANPYFHDGTAPSGGIPQLAQEYATAIKETFKGPVIIGGWSFGGIISVEIANILQSVHDITVIGILMLDSPCPFGRDFSNAPEATPSFRKSTSTETKDLVTKSFKNARKMITTWDQPAAFDAPPAVMIRAVDQPSGSSDKDNKDDGKLGWSRFDSLKFLDIVNLSGDHQGMFDHHRLDKLTDAVKSACDMIEKSTH